MGEEVNAKTVKKTQELLGAIIKKPQLTEKLLKKPPFRFLHDIIHNIIKTTKAFDGLYSANELNSDNVKEKEAKVNFLQKIIDAVVFVSGTSVTIRPSKIVAGHEADKTNEFLQMLAKVVQRKLDTKEAVAKVLTGDKPSKEIRKDKKEKSVSKSKIDPKSRREDSVKRSKQNKASHEIVQPAEENTSGGKENREKDSNDPNNLKRGRKKPTSGQRRKSPPTQTEITDQIENKSDPEPFAVGNTEEAPEPKSDHSIELENEPRPSTLSGMTNGSFEDTLPAAEARPEPSAPEESSPTEVDLAAARILLRSGRPGTSRRRPMSSVKKPSSDLGEEPAIRPSTARAIANVIVDVTSKTQVEEDDTFVEINEEDGLSELHDGVPTAPEETAADEQEGILVKQLLETKQQLENGDTTASRIQSPLVKDSSCSARDLNAIERIREHIQGVSRGALPMGRLLDLLYEDLGSMLSELNSWKQEYKKCNSEIERAMRVEDFSLQDELEQLDKDITQERETIHVLKYDILQCSEKLDKVLSGFMSKP